VIVRMLFAWSALLICAHLLVAWADSPEARCASVGGVVRTLVLLDKTETLECMRYDEATMMVRYLDFP
jgi:hypothetical protein